ncbi:molybdenum cofactor guanylyltransferase MobA [Microvirga sp. 2YAF29]|uniref:molybdenum cofactor guanylyltransferase MobA n=1 Tax=Microvirga sp. 2YAF29 TaxID=3233031 RepID=UPI003F999E24
MVPYPATLGAILGGGLARRMHGVDKALLELNGRPLLSHVCERLAPQCEGVILNATGDLSRFGNLDLPLVPDSVSGHPGPLAGILAALEWTALHRPSLEWVVSVPADTPFIPSDLVQRLHGARQAQGQPLACASSGSQDHFVIGLWPVSLRHDLQRALVEKGVCRVEEWVRHHGMARAEWPAAPSDPFFNINTPQDLAKAQGLVEPAAMRR